MIIIQVALMFSNGEKVNCGEIICEEPDYRGYIYGEFRYLPEYLNHSSAFPLDPVSLPLKESICFPCGLHKKPVLKFLKLK